jgi:hypothetical protein
MAATRPAGLASDENGGENGDTLAVELAYVGFNQLTQISNSLAVYGSHTIFLIPIVVTTATGTQLNAALIIPAVFLVLILQRDEFKRGPLFLTTSLCVILITFVLSIPAILEMTRGTLTAGIPA